MIEINYEDVYDIEFLQNNDMFQKGEKFNSFKLFMKNDDFYQFESEYASLIEDDDEHETYLDDNVDNFCEFTQSDINNGIVSITKKKQHDRYK